MIPIIFSTVTGNGFRLAEAAAKAIPDMNRCGPYNIRYITDVVIDMFDTFILTYWCDKGSADGDTLALLKKMHGKNIILLGSLGAAPDTPHADHVRKAVGAAASADNILLGHFLCRGSIDLKRTGKKLREGKMTAEHFEKQKLSQGHPDRQDLADAENAVRKFLEDA